MEQKIVNKPIRNIDINRALGRPHLTMREQEVLHWTALGKTMEETAMIMNIARKTVEHYRCRILSCFNCARMAQAITVGLEYGYLSSEKILKQ